MGSQNLLGFVSLLSVACFLMLLINFSPVDSQTAPEFEYDETNGKGPSKWATLNPAWTLCGTGLMQSPIAISSAIPLPSLGRLVTNYKPVAASASHTTHGVKIVLQGDGGGLLLDGIFYSLVQFHWHWGSEHIINGARQVLELHMVHQNNGRTAVIGILFKNGHHDKTLNELLPRMVGLTTGDKPIGIVNPATIRLHHTDYYRYMGSFTTPPCTEGVIWTVFRELNEVSQDQVNALKALSPDKFGSTARPAQALHERAVNNFHSIE